MESVTIICTMDEEIGEQAQISDKRLIELYERKEKT